MVVVASAVVVCVIVLAATVLPLETGTADARAPPKYMGVASCGASNCHGNVKGKADFPKLNENIVWRQKGRHYKAVESLSNERLKSGVRPSRVAKALNIDKPSTSERCL